MSKTEAHQIALVSAVQRLANIDLTRQCIQSGLSAPINNKLLLRAFGADIELSIPEFDGIYLQSGQPLTAVDRILILHYLLAQQPLHGDNQELSFREFPGGTFYWDAFVNRTTRPLVTAIKNNLTLLRSRLNRYDCTLVCHGDLGMRIKGIGMAAVTLIYWQGDDELQPSAEILFNQTIKTVYCTEDAAVLASRICLGLLRD